MLGDEGFRVRTARNGREALDAVAASQPALMILDLMMPQVTGMEVLDFLRDHPENSDMPVIVLSARSSHRDILEALDKGAVDFVPKPFDLDDLLLRIRVWIDRAVPHEAEPTTLRVYTLAPFRVLLGESTILDEDAGDTHSKLILKYLITHPNQVVEREALLYMVWPDLDPDAASEQLSGRIEQLRAALRVDLPGHSIHQNGGKCPAL